MASLSLPVGLSAPTSTSLSYTMGASDESVMQQLPLSGIRVLDAAQMLAGPLAASLMADFGAEVIHFELPSTGDQLRTLGPFKDGISLWWKMTSRNKKAVTLDLRHPKGQALFKRLVPIADVVIEAFRPGAMEGWGLGWDRLRLVNPKLIMARQTGFGQRGPYARRPAFGPDFEAYAGLTDRIGFLDTPPISPNLGDYFAGQALCYAIMFALYHRDVHNGPGQMIDASAAESVLRMIGDATIPGVGVGMSSWPKSPSTEPSVSGSYGDFRCRGLFTTKDGKWCTFSPIQRSLWDRFMRAIGREDYLDEASYPKGSSERKRRQQEIHDFVKGWFASQTRADIAKLGEEFEIAIGMVYTMGDVIADPHFQERNTIIDVHDHDLGMIKMVAPMPQLSETPGAVFHTGSTRLGEHNTDVYRALLGLTAEETRSLEAERVI